MTVAEAASASKVSPRTVHSAKAVLHADPKVAAKVKAGEVSVDAAAKKVRASKPPLKPWSRSRPVMERIAPLPPRGRHLTREEVDPEFVGTQREYSAKYGFVQIATAEERATKWFGGWAASLRALAQQWKSFPENQEVDLNWLRSPKARDVAKMKEALAVIEPVIASARAMLDKAEAKMMRLRPRQQPRSSPTPRPRRLPKRAGKGWSSCVLGGTWRWDGST